MKISIIIPVYNVERYIARCIESCLQQDLPETEYEIIIVNDGTRDNSMEIVQRYAQSHTNMIIIEQSNKGLSEARNAGLKKAAGEYVWFVDSDDWIEKNSLKAITDRMQKQQLDALHISVIDVKNNQKSLRFDFSKFEDSVWKGKDILSRFQFQPPAQFTIYRRNFLQLYHLSFYPNIYHEDVEFTPRAYFYAERVGYYSTPVYYYELSNTTSIMHNVSIKRVFDMSLIMQRHLAFMKDVVKDEKYMPAFGTIIGQLVNSSLMIIKRVGNSSQRKDYIQFVNDHKSDIVPLMRHCTNWYFRFESYILGLSTRLFFVYYYIVHINR